MKKMTKKIASLFLLVLLVGMCSISVNADENAGFDQYISRALKYPDTILVKSRTGIDVTQEFLTVYYTEGIDAAHLYAIENECCIQYSEAKISNLLPRGIRQPVSVVEYFYRLSYDTTGKYRKEWQTQLAGTYYQDIGTGQITGATSPSLTLSYTNFGAAFSPYMNGVRTNYSINTATNKVTFTGTYHMYATLNFSVGDLPLGFTLDFGSYQDVMTR